MDPGESETAKYGPIGLLVRLALILAAAAAGYAGFTLHESAALGLSPLREEPPSFAPYYLARSAFALLMSAWVIAFLYRKRLPGCPLDRERMGSGWQACALAAMAAAIAALLALVASPSAFAAFAQEDSPVEWGSALLLLAGAGLFAAGGAARLRRREALGALLALLFALVLFLIGMEEISWGQRLFGFATPPELAQANWQGEFNLHNVQTDLTETLYYTGAGLFLLLLPFLAEAAPDWPLPRAVRDFLPGREIAALSAPVALLTYGQWNLIPLQMIAMATVLALAAWALAARRRGDGGESRLFALLAAATGLGLVVLLAFGPRSINIWDASEYKELFIALGLFAFALQVRRRRSA
jgi:hypothetical protein